MKKFVLITLFISLAVSCKSTKKTSYKLTVEKSDTLILKQEVLKQAPMFNTLVIEEICDSTEAKEFNHKVAIGKDTVTVFVKDNTLSIEIESLEKVIKEKDSIIQIRSSEITEISKEEKTKYRWAKITWIFLGIIVVFIIFPFIPKWINRQVFYVKV